MMDKKLMEVLTTLPDSALAIVTQGAEGPHVVNSWNSYVLVTETDELLIPVGGMVETEKNVERDNKVKLTICNREVQGKAYKGTGFLLSGSAEFVKTGRDFEAIRAKFAWARAALKITVKTLTQTL